jgi:hypothetical protein
LTLVTLLGQVAVTVRVAVDRLVGAVGAVLAADRPPGQLGVPALAEHPANQRPHQHGGQRPDPGHGADLAPFGAGGLDAKAAQIGLDGAGIGLAGRDGGHHRDQDDGEHEHGQAVKQPGPAGHTAGHIATKQVRHQQHDGDRDSAAHP